MEQLAHEAHMRSLAASNALDTAIDTAAGWSHHDPGGPGGGGGGSSHSGSGGGSQDRDRDGNDRNRDRYTNGIDDVLDKSKIGGTNGGDKGKTDRTGGGNGSGGTTYDEAHNSGTFGHGNIMPTILDLAGDAVEVAVNSQASFDWDGNGFRESGNWAAADDGLLVVDLEAANLPAAPRRSVP